MKSQNTGLFLLLILLSTWACNKKKDTAQACTQEAKAALNVTVADLKTGQYLGDSVKVEAATSSNTITLELFTSSPPVFSGAYEMPGTYTLVVTHARYHTHKSAPVTVNKDDCHVIPQTVNVKLLPK